MIYAHFFDAKMFYAHFIVVIIIYAHFFVMKTIQYTSPVDQGMISNNLV